MPPIFLKTDQYPKTKERGTSGQMTEALQEAVQNLHNCRAKFREVVPVVEHFEGQTAWEGEVHVFNIEDHPTALVCYAWSSAVEGSDKRKFYAVLHVPPVTSPLEAVRASIIQDYKTQSSGDSR